MTVVVRLSILLKCHSDIWRQTSTRWWQTEV